MHVNSWSLPRPECGQKQYNVEHFDSARYDRSAILDGWFIMRVGVLCAGSSARGPMALAYGMIYKLARYGVLLGL